MKPLLRYFSCVLRVIVLLEGKPSVHLPEHSGEGFRPGYPCTWPHSSFPRLQPVVLSLQLKNMTQHDAATTMLHCWDCIGQVMSSAWFSPHITLRIKAKKFYLGLIRPENLICHHLSKFHAGFHVSCTEERIPSGHSAIKPRLVEGCSDG